jgi:putative multiple sugar transport system permease protein
VVALVGACAGTFIVTWGMNVYLSVGMCMLVGLLIGMWQGFWIAYVRIPAFIVTLAGQLVFRGLTLLILGGLTIAPMPPEFLMYSTGFVPNFLSGWLGLADKPNLTSIAAGVLLALVYVASQLRSHSSRKRKGYQVDSPAALIVKLLVISAVVVWFFYILSQYHGIPTVLIILGLILIGYSYFTSNTVMGRHIYAVGGNEKAAMLSGVKTNKILFLAYVNMALLAAVAGLVFAARLNSSSPQAGQNFELDAIGACYIGGASAYGGIGTVGGTLIGALIMGVLNNGMSIMGIDSNMQLVVKGLVLLGAVAFDVL